MTEQEVFQMNFENTWRRIRDLEGRVDRLEADFKVLAESYERFLRSVAATIQAPAGEAPT